MEGWRRGRRGRRDAVEVGGKLMRDGTERLSASPSATIRKLRTQNSVVAFEKAHRAHLARSPAVLLS